MTEATNGSGSEPLAAADRARLAKLVDSQGEVVISEEMGIPRGTLARLLAGLPVRAGTRALVSQGLEKADERKGAARR